MKKAITLFMALALVTSLFAVPQNHPTKRSIDRKATQASTFSFVSSTPAGWTVSPNPANYESKDLARGMQMTSTTTITYAGAEDVSSITVTGSTNGEGNTISVKVGTTDFGSVSLTKGDRHKAYAFSGAKSSGNVVITVTRAASSIWIESVSLDGTGGGGGEETELSGLAQAYAIYYEDEGYYWDFDLAVEFDEETTTYPELYFMCDDEAESKTSIVGTYSAYYAMAWKSAKDSIGTDEDSPVGTMTVTYVEEGVYNFVGSFDGTDGNTYTWNATNVEVIAMDADNEYEEIELNEEGGGGKDAYSFDFTKDQQNWTINNVELPTGITQVWKQSSNYGMKGSAYNKQKYAAESWLISPDINLSEFTEATLKVNQALNQGANTNMKAKISTDNGSTWTDLALNLPEGTSWDFQTDQVSLDAYVGNTVKIAFVYISTTDICPTWEIKTVSISSAAGGDTIEVKDVDGLEIDYYPSYSSTGAYDYTFLLYNSEDEDYIPMVAFDILTKEEGSYAGTYSVKDGTLTEYSYYVYGSGDEDYLEFTDGEITITDNGESNYTIKGWFTDGEAVYTVDVTLDGDYFNAEYPYEPEEKTTLNLAVTAGEEDNSYASDYGVIDIYLTTADGEVTLEYMMLSNDTYTTIPDGTYPIEASEYDEEGYIIEKAYNYFEAGYYYSSFGMAVASTYQTEEEIYYLVSGTVTIATTETGKQVTLAGTTYYGSTINATYIIPFTATEQINSEKVANKRLENGQIVIISGDKKFNVLGQRL